QGDSGAVHRARNLKLGYLPQESAWAQREEVRRGTLWEAMLPAFAALRARAAELAQLENSMADPAQRDDALRRYGPLQDQFERDGGYTYEARIKQVLGGLGFNKGDYERPLAQLSGGQKTRALLARLLLEDPDLLLLDEPTNHLDIAAVEWLESWLRMWSGAVLIVSHDRYFLDETADTIWELHFDRLETYRGNYSAYARQRAERLARRQREYAAQQAFVRKEQDYIRRNMAGQNTRQAQGRRKRLERLLKESHDNDRLVRRTTSRRDMRLAMGADVRSGDRVVETESLGVGYADDGQVLFYAPDLLLWRGELAALIGPNGAGKTTFLKTLLGEIPPLRGSVRLGASLKVGYFEQAHEGLQPERTLLQEVQSVRALTESEARNYLAQYLFTGDDVHKPVKVLSGGERGRLALAKLALQGANFLLLDEPTNHLDIPAQEVLEAVLGNFPGTVLLVSHDRYLIDRLATQVWSLSDGELTVFKGSYREFAAQRRQAGADPQAPERPAAHSRDRQSKSRPGRDERRRAARAAELETAIDATETRLAEVEREIEAAGIAQDVARVRRLGEEYEALQAELAASMAAWEAVAEPAMEVD
ncbi:MAG: ribosomal protection-like ABC-F family protein, partial [Anaerolineales bacterium]